MEAAQGKNPYLIAALKSLPLTADDTSSSNSEDTTTTTAQAASPATSASSSGSSSDGGRGIGAATAAEKQLAGALMQQLQDEMQAWNTSLVEDEQILLGLVTRPPQLAPEVAAALGRLATDRRLVAAVQYRVERKRLVQAAQVLLNVFLRD
jgi:hypothetical protein